MNLREHIKNVYDGIYLLTLSSAYERQQHMKRMFQYLGLEDGDVNMWYATAFPYNDIIIDAFNSRQKGKFSKPNEYDCARNHYGIIKTAYDLGKKRILIMEDDILLRGDDIINNIVSVPDDSDIVLMSAFTVDPKIKSYLNKDSFWQTCEIPLWNTSMYSMSRKGMEYYLAFMDKFFWVADGPTYMSYKYTNIKRYIATVPLAIQADKNTVPSYIRNSENDHIDYQNDNMYESLIDKKKYLDF